jgi:phosphoglycerate kinase
MAKALLSDVDPALLAGRRVVVRCDLNVPLADGVVTDDTRIRASLATLRYLQEDCARTVVLSHLGRPKGSVDPSASLAPVARHLGELLGSEVAFCPDLAGCQAAEAVDALKPGQVLVLENTRFDPGETANDPELATRLADNAELFVNDAFGTAHRAHASTEGIARVVRDRGGLAVAGFLLERELAYLQGMLEAPSRPFVAVIGGSKISGKIDVIEALLPRVDRLLIGGAMANTFFVALGLEVGDSLVEPDRVDLAGDLLERAGAKLLLPIDVRVAEQIDVAAEPRVAARTEVKPRERVADVGPDTERLFADELQGAATVLWNGPMGVFEMAPFAKGTLAIANSAAEAADQGSTVVVGGGDSVAAVEQAGVASRLTHISTGGGASLDLLAGKTLPGVQILSERGSLPQERAP